MGLSVTVPALSVSVTGLSVNVYGLSVSLPGLSVANFPDSRTEALKVADCMVCFLAQSVFHHVQSGSPYLGQA